MIAEKRTRRDRDRLVRGTHDVARVRADELALAVEVGRDDDVVGLLGEALDRLDDALLGGQLAARERTTSVGRESSDHFLSADRAGSVRRSPAPPPGKSTPMMWPLSPMETQSSPSRRKV